MVVKAVQNYVNLVNGLTKMTQDRALATARSLLAHAGLEDVANDATGRVTKLAEEIMLASRANRELMENLVAGEVDKAAGRFGYVRTDEVEALREEIADLRASLARAAAEADRPAKKATGRKSASAASAAGAAGFATSPAAQGFATPPVSGTAKKTTPRAPRKRSTQPPLGGAPATPGSDPFSETVNEGPDISSPLPPGPVIPNPVEVGATSPAEPTSPAGEQEPIALGSAVSEAIEARTPVAELEVPEPHEAALELVTTTAELVPTEPTTEPTAGPTPPEASTTDKAAAKRAASRKSATPRKATTKKSAAAKTSTAGTSSTRKAPASSTTKKSPAKRATKKSSPAGTPETEMPAVMNVDQDADQ